MPEQEGINIIGDGLPQLTSPAELAGGSIEVAKLIAGVVTNHELPLGVLFAALNQNLAAPNNRKDLRKMVSCKSTTQPGYPAGRTAMNTLDPEFLCLGCVCIVEVEEDGTHAYSEYELKYDATGPLMVWTDGTFQNNGKVPARWFRKGSTEGAVAGIPPFNPLATRYPPGAQVVSENRLWATDTELLRASYSNDRIPTPNDTDGVWREISKGASTYQEGGVALIRSLADAEALVPGLLQVIYRTSGVVYINAVTPASLSPEGVYFNPSSGALEPVNYDLGTDAVTPRSSGGGGAGDVTQADLAAANTANRARANHTGTQLAATISDFATAATARITAATANNLTTTATGKVLDARQGKVLADRLGIVENDLTDAENDILALDNRLDIIEPNVRPGTGAGSFIVGNRDFSNEASGDNDYTSGGYNNRVYGNDSEVHGGSDNDVYGVRCRLFGCTGCIVPASCADVVLVGCTGLNVGENTTGKVYVDNAEVSGLPAYDPSTDEGKVLTIVAGVPTWSTPTGNSTPPPPAAPTGLTVDNTARTATFNLAAGKVASDYEYEII